MILTKTEFCKVMSEFKKAREAEKRVDQIAKDMGSDFLQIDLTYLGGPLTTVLDKMFDSDDHDVEYFCWELDFGDDYHPGDVTDKDGNEIDFSTAEKLYDYLVYAMDKKHKGGDELSEDTKK